MAAKRLAVSQSSYIPWKGYFDLIRAADQFVLLDDVQFTKRDWRSRNRIKTKDGGAWLSIPVHTSGRFEQRIEDATISDPGWAVRHWDTIRRSYARAPFFDAFAPFVEPLYMNPVSDRLSLVNHAFILAICRLLGITTPIAWSSAYRTRSTPNERLIDICLACGATDYVSGPSARGYLDETAFNAAGISVHFADYNGYPEYEQPYPPFEHAVSALDLLFCTGPRALTFMKAVVPALSLA
ncbi:MAG TPA: WbqC family protein [Vicinamibacterales bacterium]